MNKHFLYLLKRFSLIWGALWVLTSSLATADLIAWWPFDGDLRDGGTNALDGEPIGEPTFDAGSALQLPAGDAEGVRIPAADSLNAPVFSLGYRINLNGVAQGNAGLERLTSREGDSFETAIGDANALGGTASTTGVTLSYYQGGWNVTDVEIPETGWAHVIWRNTASEMELYLDGELAFTGPSAPDGSISGFMNIGIRHNGIEGFEGFIDDAFLWDDSVNPLTPENMIEIAENGMSAYLGLETDADHDGLPDAWEEEYGLASNDDGSVDPANGPEGDPDEDGLTNQEELALRTSPKNEDTDGDGLKDGEEKNLETNPTKADPDRDGLTDAEEIALETDPNKTDSDGDGFPDGFEVTNNTDPLDPNDPPPGEAVLVLHLSFDGDIEDVSGSGNDGEFVGEPEFDSDAPPGLGGGQAIRFREGDGDGVSIAAADPLNADVFTLAYFINQAGAVQGNAGLERLTSRGGDSFETAIGDRNAVGGGEPGTLSYYAPSVGWVSTETVVPDDGWVHVTWRNKGTGPEDMELLVDCEQVYAGPGISPPSGLMNVGIRHNDVEGFEGLMDDLRLYSGALSNEEVAGLCEAGPGPSITNILLTDNGVQLKWTSSDGQYFDVQKSTNLMPESWEAIATQVPATDQETTLEVAREAGDTQVFYRVARVAPPALYSYDFEGADSDWTTGIIDLYSETATTWERGAPASGPDAAVSGDSVFGTDLDALYVDSTGVFLRSPNLDFSARERTKLSFWYYLDVSNDEGGRLNVLDGDNIILQKIYTGTTEQWVQETVSLPELGDQVVLEFQFLTDTVTEDNGTGWFIDDVRVE